MTGTVTSPPTSGGHVKPACTGWTPTTSTSISSISAKSAIPTEDVRRRWDFGSGEQAAFLRRLDALRVTLTSDGRNVAQGALEWMWARGLRTIPIPSFKTVAQVEDLAGAARFGPLSPDQMSAVAEILARSIEAST